MFEDAQPMLLIACFFKTQNLFLIASAGAIASRRFPVLGFSLARKTWFTEVTSPVVDLHVQKDFYFVVLCPDLVERLNSSIVEPKTFATSINFMEF